MSTLHKLISSIHELHSNALNIWIEWEGEKEKSIYDICSHIDLASNCVMIISSFSDDGP